MFLKSLIFHIKPKYSNLTSRFFNNWKREVIGQQKYEYKQLEITTDILTDELE